MYTEQSVELKSDFYSRYGNAEGMLYFERTGIPCTVMDSGTHMLAFSLGCGVRAYGRAYGDVIKIINAVSSACDVHFAPDGMGAQILYRADIGGLPYARETAQYTVNKLLHRMYRSPGAREADIVAICDRYGSDGWCAYYDRGTVRRLPLPLLEENVILIRVGRTYKRAPEAVSVFCTAETERIKAAAQALGKCRTDVFFEMIDESGKSAQRLLEPMANAVYAAEAARAADGVIAARICDIGVICICESDKTDVAVSAISAEYGKNAGYPPSILVVK